MLNVESKLGAFCVWSIISLICIVAAWSVLRIPPPSTLVSDFFASETAKTIERFQTLLGFLLGFGTLAAAYLWNGAKGRQARKAARDTRKFGLASSLSAELSDLILDCNSKARESWALAEQIENGEMPEDEEMLLPEGLFKAIASPLDTVLVGIRPEALTSLGAHSYSHLRRLRQELRYIEDLIDQAPTEQEVPKEEKVAFFKELARNYAGLSHACIHVKEAVEGKGNHAADGSCCDSPQLISQTERPAITNMTH